MTTKFIPAPRAPTSIGPPASASLPAVAPTSSVFRPALVEVPKVSSAKVDPILRIDKLREITGLSTGTIYRYMSHGLFPRQVRLGPGTVGWKLSAVQAWLDQRETA